MNGKSEPEKSGRPDGAPAAAVKGVSLWSDAWRRLKTNRLAMACLAVIAIFAAAALYGEIVRLRYRVADAQVSGWSAPVHKFAVKVLRAERVRGQVPPYMRQDLDRAYEPPSLRNIMGTDALGRDVFQRVVQVSCIAFRVGIITSLIAIFIGVVLGCIAGYFGGWVDDFIVWIYSSFACMPTLLFILAIAMKVQKGLIGIYLGIGFTTWVGLCRLIRAEVMRHKERMYVQAAKTLGFGHARVIFGHILPNVLHLVIISFSLRFPAAIGTEIFMSFLGIGVEGEPSWGVMISSSRLRLWYGVWWELGFTTAAIFLMVLAFNLLGDALRDALDPRLRQQSDL